MGRSTRLQAVAVAAVLTAIATGAMIWARAHGSAATAQSAGASAAAGGSAAPAGQGNAGSEAAGGARYPVASVAPVERSFARPVQAFGVLQPDVRSLQTISLATVGVVRAVHVLPGQRIVRGAPLFTVEPDPLAHLAYRQASSALRIAQAEVERLRIQRAEQLATATQVEAAEKAVADAEAGIEAARRQDATERSDVVRSPVDGVVSSIGVAIGDRPAVGSALAVVAPSKPLRVTMGIEPDDAARVRPDDRISIQLVPGAEQPLNGRVLLVGAALDRVSRMVPVTVALDANDNDEIIVGRYAVGRIQTRAATAFSLPRTAIVTDDDGTAVFEIVAGRAHRVAVAIEADEGRNVGVSGRLSPSRRVIVVGAYQLEDGVPVVESVP